jgi:adenosylcobinamide-GDP ribazoletransferase
MRHSDWPIDPPADIRAVLTFYTRLPLQTDEAGTSRFAEQQWAAPIAGAFIGLGAAMVLAVSGALGLSPAIAAAAALAATLWFTAALHEDGLADLADGLGGGHSPAARLEVMRDSRIGTFGVVTLVMVLILRWQAIAMLATSGGALAGLIAAHAASRALIAPFMRVLPPARTDGLSALAGIPSGRTACIALALGAVMLLVLGLSEAIVAVVLLAAWFALLSALCRSRLGGQTGDTLGALQQGAETLVLLTAAAFVASA